MLGVYRYGFNGKENDNEVKGEGNQYDYGFRIYDPRIGKFLSVDPLMKDYPMLTPYQYASNNPISGIDLDGLEYLNFNKALVQFKRGTLELKLANMHNVTIRAIRDYVNDPKNWPVDETGQKSQGVSLTVATFSMETPNPSTAVDGVNLSDKDEDPTYDPAQHQVSIPTAASTGRPDRRYKQREINGASPARPTAGKVALAINVVNFALERIGNWMINSDINDVKEQAKKYGLLVTEDINIAIGKGLIPERYQNQQSLIDIGNVILQGVNNTNDKEIYNIGMKIFNEISSRNFPQTGTIKSTLDNIPSRQIEIKRTSSAGKKD